MANEIKLKWLVGEEPVGKFKSFQDRAFPSANYANGEIAGCLYHPSESYTGAHRTATDLHLVIRVAVWKIREEDNHLTFEWQQLRVRATSIAEGKKRLAAFLNKNKQFAHPDYR